MDRYTHEKVEISDDCFLQIITGIDSSGEVITSVRLISEEYVENRNPFFGGEPRLKSEMVRIPFGTTSEDLEEMDKLISALIMLRKRAELLGSLDNK